MRYINHLLTQGGHYMYIVQPVQTSKYIEKLRYRMISLAHLKGISDPSVLAVSKELDKKVIEKQKEICIY